MAEDNILTLDEAIAEVAGANPDIRASYYQTEAAKARIPQAKALDDPMVGVEFYNVPIDTADVTKSDDIDYSIEQKIPFPGKRYVRGKVARFDAAAVAEESRGRVWDVILDLKKTYYDVYRIERQLAVNRENQGLVRQFLGSTKTWYATGQTTADAPLKAQVELSNLKNQEILLNQERTTHLSHLSAILNRPSHEEIHISNRIQWPKLTASLEQIRAMAGETRPELQALGEMQKRDKAKVTSAKQSLIPDFTFGFVYKQRPGNRQDVWAGSAAMNLPIFFWGKNRAEIQEAKASLKATEAMQQSMQLHTHHDIDGAYSAFKAAQKLVSSYQGGILPQAKTTLDAAREAYASRKVDFLTLIDAARTYKDLQMSFYETQATVGTTFAELERLVGTDLSQNKKGVIYEE